MHTSLKNKTTLVTGVTSGIGREIAQLLAEQGARVFGTARNPQSASPIPGVEIVRMEVTDDASVNDAVQNILQKAGGSAKNRTRRRSSNGGGSGLECIDRKVTTAALSGWQRCRL